MSVLMDSRSNSPFKLVRQVVDWWPYLLIGICITGFAYRFLQFLRR